tara:strand:- start:309 stop:647 length:339 start_codon:yes stop_codon:yes gene_type:complete
MKTYNNGPRKAMMYGGAAKRKPMMYGGTAMMKKPRKKAYGGGMMSAKQGQQNQMQNTMMQQPKLANTGMMAKGGEASEFGMLSVKAGIDNNPKPTAADRIAGATKGKKKTSA